MVFPMMRIQQLWAVALEKAITSAIPRGAGVFVSTSFFRNAPSLGALPGTSQPQSGSGSTSLWMSSQVGQLQDTFTAFQQFLDLF